MNDQSVSIRTSLVGIGPDHLHGFFVGWPNPPSPEMHLQILRDSDAVVLATNSARVVGFVNAISDGHLCAYIPLLEVLPSCQHRGIGSLLVRTIVEQLGHLYMIDLRCDAELLGFYESLGFSAGPPSRPTLGLGIRNYKRQSGV